MNCSYFRFPDDSYGHGHAFVDTNGTKHPANVLKLWDAAELNAIGVFEAIPLERDQHTTYTTQWVKGEDLIYREEIVTAVVDEVAKMVDEYEDKFAEIRDKANAVLADAGKEYSEWERETWDQQYDEAVARQKNPNESVPLLEAIATARGMDVDELAGRIVSNRAAWVVSSGEVVGKRLAYNDALDSAVILFESDRDAGLAAIQDVAVLYPTI